MTNMNMLFRTGLVSNAWVAERERPKEPVRSPFALLPIVASVLIAHLGLFALIVSQTSNKEITLASLTPPASVRVTMVSAVEPEPARVEPVPPTPQVLTTENSDRTVAHQEAPKPVPPPKPVVKPKPKLKPVVKLPEPVPKVEEKVVEQVKTPPQQFVEAAEPIGRSMDLPAAGAKDVQSVGCRVPAPTYPRQARRQKVEGNVFVRLQIDVQGRVESAAVVRSSGNTELDEAARKTVLSASCTPYMENGRAIAVRAVQPVSFRLTR